MFQKQHDTHLFDWAKHNQILQMNQNFYILWSLLALSHCRLNLTISYHAYTQTSCYCIQIEKTLQMDMIKTAVKSEQYWRSTVTSTSMLHQIRMVYLSMHSTGSFALLWHEIGHKIHFVWLGLTKVSDQWVLILASVHYSIVLTDLTNMQSLNQHPIVAPAWQLLC